MKTPKMPQERLHRPDVGLFRLRGLFKAFGAVFKPVPYGMRTANSSNHQLSAFVTGNSPDISTIPDGGWYTVAPYGIHDSPDRTYTQVFERPQAENVVKTWNSMAGKAARWFKNMVHGLGGKFSAPVWDGHPDQDAARWPVERLLGEVIDLRVGDTGLEGRQTWNAKGLARRTGGPLYPSPLWWHEVKDQQNRVFPQLLESVGLVPAPNIAAVPAWTANASPDPASAEVLSQTAHHNNHDHMINIAKKLGLPDTATESEITAKIAELQSTANAAAENIRTTNSVRDQFRTSVAKKLSLPDASNETEITTKITEVLDASTTAAESLRTANASAESLRTANAELTGIITELVGGVVHGFELGGIITPAERESIKGKLTANATAKSTVAELKAKKAVMNTKSIELGANRHDISTANSRRDLLETEITRRMKDNGGDRDKAFTACQADPALKALFDAMADPTKAAA